MTKRGSFRKKKGEGGSKVAIIKREGRERERERDCTFHNYTTFSLASDFQLQ